MLKIPSQCKLCINMNIDEGLCKIHEQLPGEFGRENVTDCPSFIEKDSKQSDDLHLLLKYIDEDPTNLDNNISKAVDNILSDYETKYKVMIVGIARRKIKSIIRMVDIIDSVLDKLGGEDIIDKMAPSQAIRLLSELNNSVNNDLTFIMKLVNPDTKLQDLQMWVDARSVVNISGVSQATDMKADEILKLSGASRDKIRDAFDTLLHQISNDSEDMVDVINTEDIEDE